jgi:hypothetical protein
MGEWLGRRDSCRVATNVFVARMPESLRISPNEAKPREWPGIWDELRNWIVTAA